MLTMLPSNMNVGDCHLMVSVDPRVRVEDDRACGQDRVLQRVLQDGEPGADDGVLVHATSRSLMAASIRDGVTGTRRMPTPVALRIAARTAGAVGMRAGSPTPLAP
jgi:hypothetical protein